MKFSDKVIYQIYTKSYMDSNGDGLGDITGVIEKLDYLKDLGIDYIWMTPFFKSPLNDNGYDVADYINIDERFGTMEDVERLIAEAKKRNIGLMFDMVFNHTSTEHEWFKRALNGEEKYMNYYIFKDGEKDAPPTNWESKFGGNAWEYVPHLKKWYLHLFDKTQADLNWDNKEVRDELKKVLLFWKEKGVSGFRFDVVNLISKPAVFENDSIGDGRRFYTDGPHVHEYLKEMVKEAGIEDMVTVGEMSSTSLENCIKYTRSDEKELSMVFNFHHLKVDYKNGDKWELQEPDIEKLKELFFTWQEGMQEDDGWNAVFWCNHDQPRAVSRFANDKEYWAESAKMLGTAVHMLRGTPYIFQGEEIGTTNNGFTKLTQYKDVESINYYNILRERGKSEEEAMKILAERSRDNGRCPMQWDGSKNAGFTTGEPWIEIPENHSYINVEAEKADKNSILNYYKELINIRKTEKAISDGSIEFIHKEVPYLFAYTRKYGNECISVYNNFSENTIDVTDKIWDNKNVKLLGNYEDLALNNSTLSIRPYEALVIKHE